MRLAWTYLNLYIFWLLFIANMRLVGKDIYQSHVFICCSNNTVIRCLFPRRHYGYLLHISIASYILFSWYWFKEIRTYQYSHFHDDIWNYKQYRHTFVYLRDLYVAILVTEIWEENNTWQQKSANLIRIIWVRIKE